MPRQRTAKEDRKTTTGTETRRREKIDRVWNKRGRGLRLAILFERSLRVPAVLFQILLEERFKLIEWNRAFAAAVVQIGVRRAGNKIQLFVVRILIPFNHISVRVFAKVARVRLVAVNDQHGGAYFVRGIDGDYLNVIGLPVCLAAELAKEHFGIDIFSETHKNK